MGHQLDRVISQPGLLLDWVISEVGRQLYGINNLIRSLVGWGHQPAWVVTGLGHQPGWAISWIGHQPDRVLSRICVGSSARLGCQLDRVSSQMRSSAGSGYCWVASSARVGHQLDWVISQPGPRVACQVRSSAGSGLQPCGVFSLIGSSVGWDHQAAWVITGLGLQLWWLVSWIGL